MNADAERDELMAICRYEAAAITAHLYYESMPKGLRERLEAQRDRLVLAGDQRAAEAYVRATHAEFGFRARDRAEVKAAVRSAAKEGSR